MQSAKSAAIAVVTTVNRATSIDAKGAGVGLFSFFKRNAETTPVEQAVRSDRRSKPRKDPHAGTRILIVDDSATILAALRNMLANNNRYIVLEALDAEIGLNMALTDMPDLIFLDLVLPGMSGFEALRKLRKNEITREIPVIVMSGNEAAIEEFYVQRIGADDFMKKPFLRAEVYARIEKLIGVDGGLHRPAMKVAKPA
jgi:PleD family two-component response regulator